MERPIATTAAGRQPEFPKQKMENVLVQVTPVVTTSSLSTMLAPALHLVGAFARPFPKPVLKSTIQFVVVMEKSTATNVFDS